MKFMKRSPFNFVVFSSKVYVPTFTVTQFKSIIKVFLKFFPLNIFTTFNFVSEVCLESSSMLVKILAD